MKQQYPFKSAFLMLTLLAIALVFAACNMSPQGRVAGSGQEIIRAYIVDINEQARTVTVDEVNLYSQADTEGIRNLGLNSADFRNGYYAHNDNYGRRMLSLANNVEFDFDAGSRLNQGLDSNLNGTLRNDGLTGNDMRNDGLNDGAMRNNGLTGGATTNDNLNNSLTDGAMRNDGLNDGAARNGGLTGGATTNDNLNNGLNDSAARNGGPTGSLAGGNNGVSGGVNTGMGNDGLTGRNTADYNYNTMDNARGNDLNNAENRYGYGFRSSQINAGMQGAYYSPDDIRYGYGDNSAVAGETLLSDNISRIRYNLSVNPARLYTLTVENGVVVKIEDSQYLFGE